MIQSKNGQFLRRDELEAMFRITTRWQVRATASANSATITKSNNPIDVAVGQHLIDVPGVTATAETIYSAPVGANVTFTGLVDYTYTGHSYGTYQPANPNYNNPAYGVVNINASLTLHGTQIALYVKNVLDNKTIIQSPEINTVVEGYTVHPRTIGVSTRIPF